MVWFCMYLSQSTIINAIHVWFNSIKLKLSTLKCIARSVYIGALTDDEDEDIMATLIAPAAAAHRQFNYIVHLA